MVIGLDIQDQLDELGCEVIGPIRRLAEAMALVATGEKLDGAILDINIAGDPCFPLAAELQRRNVPFVFLTGQRIGAVPDAFSRVPWIQKPFGTSDIRNAVQTYFVAPRDAARQP